MKIGTSTLSTYYIISSIDNGRYLTFHEVFNERSCTRCIINSLLCLGYLIFAVNHRFTVLVRRIILRLWERPFMQEQTYFVHCVSRAEIVFLAVIHN